MFKGLMVLAILAAIVVASSALLAADKAGSAAGANVTINRCTLAPITVAEDSKCQRVSYSSLTAKERSGLDRAASLSGGGSQATTTCHFWIVASTNGFSCIGETKMCSCFNSPSGPQCGCSPIK